MALADLGGRQEVDRVQQAGLRSIIVEIAR
jgi:hypothetical protein